jgi:hypothetical protein
MRMIIPGLRQRRTVDRLLTAFFREHRSGLFRQAVSALSRFYDLPVPRVDWFEYLDWGKTAGRTYENGKIQLVHPENWKRGRKYNSERQWINTVYHEMGHYVFWADAERKADGFAYRFVRGIWSQQRGGGERDHRQLAASRARRKRPHPTRRSRPGGRRGVRRVRHRRACSKS